MFNNKSSRHSNRENRLIKAELMSLQSTAREAAIFHSSPNRGDGKNRKTRRVLEEILINILGKEIYYRIKSTHRMEVMKAEKHRNE